MSATPAPPPPSFQTSTSAGDKTSLGLSVSTKGSILTRLGYFTNPSFRCSLCKELMCDAVVCDCGGPNKLHYFCEICAEGDTNVGANPEVVKFRKERFLGICPTAKVKSTIREDWRKRTEIDNVKIKQCPYAMGYVEFEECQQPIGAGPNLKGAKIGEEVRRD